MWGVVGGGVFSPPTTVAVGGGWRVRPWRGAPQRQTTQQRPSALTPPILLKARKRKESEWMMRFGEGEAFVDGGFRGGAVQMEVMVEALMEGIYGFDFSRDWR